jgi:6-phosphofructokinase 1
LKLGGDALIVGGEDTLGVARKGWKYFGVKVVSVPKTIDNDLNNTITRFGFDTSVQHLVEAEIRVAFTPP